MVRLRLLCTILSLLLLACPARAAGEDLYRQAMVAITEGRMADAERSLAALVANEPRHAGAWLDLALLYCAAGREAAAMALFDDIEARFSPPPAILDVIVRQRGRGCAAERVAQQTAVRLGRGHESNVNIGASNPHFAFGSGNNRVELTLLPAYQPQSDDFSQVDVELQRVLSRDGASATLQFQSRNYDRLQQFSSMSLFGGADYPWQWAGWGWRAGGLAGMMLLDNEVYWRQVQLQLEALPPLALPKGWQFGLSSAWTSMVYPALESQDAHLGEMRSALSYRSDSFWWQASLGVMRDTQVRTRAGGNRDGMFASLQGRFLLGNGWRGEFGMQRQHWQGDDVYLPNLIDKRRQQDTDVLHAALVLPLTTGQSLQLDVRRVRNRENISLFTYDNDIMRLQWLWTTSK